MKRTNCLGTMLLASCLTLVGHVTRADERDDFFEAKIRPVLAETCFRCHGDTKTSGDLRVNSREWLLEGGESGPAIVLDDPESSLLIKAISRLDDVSPMPPEDEESLRADQVADFLLWIKQGAAWPGNTARFESARHWAFLPIADVTPPVALSDEAGTIQAVASAASPSREGIQSGIDAFIRAKQHAAGVRPAMIADKRTLIRRATLDLTGLPPTPDEVQAFENDYSPYAFEAVVDRLLKSPSYGERWGRHWLDVVRYADTAGETADYPVPLAWRYRNYVIDAFNHDKPYDEFLREQIAGDILAEQRSTNRDDASDASAGDYAEQVTATGYLAISRRFGFDSENYHHLTIQDTIDNLGQAVLGLSLGCARCHDHKFDAVSMRDYYALYGIFDSSRYAFPGSEQKQKVRSMLPLLAPSESLPKWRKFDGRVAALAASLERLQQSVPAAIVRSLHDLDGDFELQAVAAGGSYGVLVPPWRYEGEIAITNAAQSPFKNAYPRGKVGVSVPEGEAKYRIAQALYHLRTSDLGSRLHVNLDFRVLAGDHHVVNDNRREPHVARMRRLHRFWIGAMPDSPAVEVLIGADSISLQSGNAIELVATLLPNQWHNLQLSLDLATQSISGRVGTPGNIVEFSDKRFSPMWSGNVDLVVLESEHVPGVQHDAIEFDNLAVQESPIALVSTEPLASTEGNTGEHASAEVLKQELEQLLANGPFDMAYGVSEGTPHDVRVQLRGEPDQLGDEVPRGFLKVLGGDLAGVDTAGSGRLELAEWITRPDNPLTARVMVNRIWQHHFGRGLVKTANDFGVRGLPPTHPELLDYLAKQFIDHGWSVKAMHRLIMLSATYQQSAHKETSDSHDPDLYVSFPRRRLSAEEIRDAILATSGELDRTPAQGHPFPTPVHWGYTQHSPFSAVYDHNRRSVYLMVQRLKRHPFLALFDGADPNASTATRMGTTVPTQALFFLNDPFVHSKAEKWATRLLAASTDERRQIEQASWEAYGRSPTETELNEASEFLARYRSELNALRRDDSNTQSLAAYLRTLFGSNEFLHVD